MRIKRMTITLPARLARTAENQARLIAQAAAERLGDDSASNLRLDVEGRGASGYSLASNVAARLASLKQGGR